MENNCVEWKYDTLCFYCCLFVSFIQLDFHLNWFIIWKIPGQICLLFQSAPHYNKTLRQNNNNEEIKEKQNCYRQSLLSLFFVENVGLLLLLLLFNKNFVDVSAMERYNFSHNNSFLCTKKINTIAQFSFGKDSLVFRLVFKLINYYLCSKVLFLFVWLVLTIFYTYTSFIRNGDGISLESSVKVFYCTKYQNT